MASFINLIRRAKLVLAVVFLQGGTAGLSILCAFALKQGMSLYTFVVYRMAIATIVIAPLALFFDRKTRPRLTFSIIARAMLLSLFENFLLANVLILIMLHTYRPVLGQNLFYLGLKLSTPTFSSAMSNTVPAFAFLMAWIFRLEKVSKISLENLHSLAKILGTLVTVGGAMMSILVKGPSFSLPWAKEQQPYAQQKFQTHPDDKDLVKGALLIAASGLSWSCFIVLQTFTLRSYQCQLSLTALTCFTGMVEAAVLALVMEWRNSEAWSIHLDTKLLAFVYGGILSGVSSCVMGMVVRAKGPVFYSAFNPLGTIMVAILGSFVLAEKMYLGSLIGAIIIIFGLYMVLWGKGKDSTSITIT